MEPADGISEDLGMLGDDVGYLWMGELQQQGARCAEKDRSLSVDSPRRRVRAKHARQRSGRVFAHEAQLNLEIIVTNHRANPRRRSEPAKVACCCSK